MERIDQDLAEDELDRINSHMLSFANEVLRIKHSFPHLDVQPLVDHLSDALADTFAREWWRQYEKTGSFSYPDTLPPFGKYMGGKEALACLNDVTLKLAKQQDELTAKAVGLL